MTDIRVTRYELKTRRVNVVTPGKTGAPGAPGANGLSAFELAQQAGFTGTYEEWVAIDEARFAALELSSQELATAQAQQALQISGLADADAAINTRVTSVEGVSASNAQLISGLGVMVTALEQSDQQQNAALTDHEERIADIENAPPSVSGGAAIGTVEYHHESWSDANYLPADGRVVSLTNYPGLSALQGKLFFEALLGGMSQNPHYTLYGASYWTGCMAAQGEIVVKIGQGGSGMISLDGGLSWEKLPNPCPIVPNAMAFSGSGRLVAVGFSGAWYYCDNITAASPSWASVTPVTTNALYQLVWNGSKFLAIGANGTWVASDNGATLRTGSIGYDTSTSLIWDGQKFVAGGALQAFLAHSADGETGWTATRFAYNNRNVQRLVKTDSGVGILTSYSELYSLPPTLDAILASCQLTQTAYGIVQNMAYALGHFILVDSYGRVTTAPLDLSSCKTVAIEQGSSTIRAYMVPCETVERVLMPSDSRVIGISKQLSGSVVIPNLKTIPANGLIPFMRVL